MIVKTTSNAANMPLKVLFNFSPFSFKTTRPSAFFSVSLSFSENSFIPFIMLYSLTTLGAGNISDHASFMEVNIPRSPLPAF